MPDWTTITGLFNYWVVIFLMMTGFYIVIGQRNLVKSIIGLNLFQTSVFLLYITMGKVKDGTAPIIPPDIAEAMAHASHDAHASHAPHDRADVNATLDSHGPHDSLAALDSSHSIADGHIQETLESHSHHVTDHAEHLVEHTDQAHGPVFDLVYSNPLPSVLMLTAIVVGIATTALALALVVRIREDYGTIEEDEILALDEQDNARVANHLGEAGT